MMVRGQQAIVPRPSPNHGPRPAGVSIDMLVLHYTGMRNGAEALARLCDPQAEVSAHYTVDIDGRIYRHVDEARRAWQAGPSHWAGRDDVNSRSVGIEIVNPGHEWGLAPFPPIQIMTVIHLSRAIIDRHGIQPAGVVAHSDIAPLRKSDPGELFPWRQLAAAGIGHWPHIRVPTRLDADVGMSLESLGYGVAKYGLTPCLHAFQRRYRPARIDGVADPETRSRIAALLQDRSRAL